MNLEFTSDNIRILCAEGYFASLFRVTQEALHNAVKYSGVDEFTVDLRELRWTVSCLRSGMQVWDLTSRRQVQWQVRAG